MSDSHIHPRGAAKFVPLFFIVMLLTSIFPPPVFSAPQGDARGTREYWISRYGEVNKGPLFVRACSVFRAVLAASDRRDGVEPTLHVLVSIKDRNGYIYAGGRVVDYFEF